MEKNMLKYVSPAVDYVALEPGYDLLEVTSVYTGEYDESHLQEQITFGASGIENSLGFTVPTGDAEQQLTW